MSDTEFVNNHDYMLQTMNWQIAGSTWLEYKIDHIKWYWNLWDPDWQSFTVPP